MGLYAEQATGVDVLPEAIARARRVLPGPTYIVSDIGDMRDVATGAYDITCAQFSLVHCPIETTRQAAAREMIRVTRPGGYIIVLDWRYSRPKADLYGVDGRWLREHFQVGKATDWVRQWPAQLVPAVGRVISRWTPALYFPLQRLLPFLVGAKLTLLRKRG